MLPSEARKCTHATSSLTIPEDRPRDDGHARRPKFLRRGGDVVGEELDHRSCGELRVLRGTNTSALLPSSSWKTQTSSPLWLKRRLKTLRKKSAIASGFSVAFRPTRSSTISRMNASFVCPILLRSPLLDFEDVPFRIAKIGPWRPGLVVDDVPDRFDSSTKEFGMHGRDVVDREPDLEPLPVILRVIRSTDQLETATATHFEVHESGPE
jgi:hypothetical protein